MSEEKTSAPAKFKAGDVVMLTCGGPKMTITVVERGQCVVYKTIWFNYQNYGFFNETFCESALKLAVDSTDLTNPRAL